MLKVSHIESHYGLWRYSEVLDVSTFSALKQFSQFLITSPTLNEETRTILVGGEKHKLVAFNRDRSYKKLWHLPLRPGYWYQTQDTIYEWAQRELKLMHPALRMLVAKIATLEPFNDGRQWIPYRGIFNYLKAGVALDPHTDGSSGYEYDVDKHTLYSSTIYFSIPAEGGEFWNEHGILFKPTPNECIINADALMTENRLRKVVHGVRAGSEDRLGFTIRWLPIEHLILPGDPNLLMYRPAE